jgi:hypothetical protein
MGVGTDGVGTDVCWNRRVLEQMGVGTDGCWNRRVLEQMGVGTDGCWNRRVRSRRGKVVSEENNRAAKLDYAKNFRSMPLQHATLLALSRVSVCPSLIIT